MKLKLNPFTCITLFDPDFIKSINTVIGCTNIDISDGVVLTFSPSTHSVGHDNLSSMELAIDRAGNMQYFIVYSKSVSPRVVETHWNFIDGTYTNLTEISDLVVGRGSLQLITRNLSGQINASLYQIDIAPLFNRPKTAQSP